MKRFHVDKISGVTFAPVVKKSEAKGACQINEPFEVGTRNGIQSGVAGDYLLDIVSENNVCRISKGEFDKDYSFVKVPVPEEDTTLDLLREEGRILKVKNCHNMGAAKLLNKIIAANVTTAVKVANKKIPIKSKSKKK